MARVLIAEDDPETALIWRLALEDDGHSVVVEHSGDDAVSHLRAAAFDVIITDFNMASGGGVLVSGFARARNHNARILAVSGFLDRQLGDRPVRELLWDLGVRHFLEKPVDLFDLRATVQRLAALGSEDRGEAGGAPPAPP